MRRLLPLLLIASTTAHAEGLYVEGGLLARRYDLSVPGATSTDSAKGRVLSPLLRLGYALDEHWSVEAGYAGHGAPAYGYRLGAQDGRQTARGHSWLLSGRGRFALNERWGVFGRVGLAHNQSRLDGSGEASGRAVRGSTTALHVGLGLDTALTEHCQLAIAWEHLGKSREKGGTTLNGIATTLRYKF